MKKFFTPLLVGLGFVLVLAFILAMKAFIWVFATIFHYGIIALIVTFIIGLIIYARNVNKKKPKI